MLPQVLRARTRPRPATTAARAAGLPRLNLGCGPVQPCTWVNIDGSNRAWLARHLWPLDGLLVRLGLLRPTEFGRHVRVLDLRKPLPFTDGSVGGIYAGEVWEHFELADAVRLTAECFRVLAPGGRLRLCVPDGAAFWQRYLELYGEQMALPQPLRRGAALRNHVRLYFHDIATRRIWLGSLGHTHKWQFDEVQLVELLQDAGFTAVQRMAFHCSGIDGIGAVERSDFLIVEGVKPACARAARRASDLANDSEAQAASAPVSEGGSRAH